MLELMYKMKEKEYKSTDAKKNYFYLTPDGVLHGVDGAKFAFEYSVTEAIVSADEDEIRVANGYPQYNGKSIIVHGVENGGLVVQYGSTKESRGYKTIPYANDIVLSRIAKVYTMLLQSK